MTTEEFTPGTRLYWYDGRGQYGHNYGTVTRRLNDLVHIEWTNPKDETSQFTQDVTVESLKEIVARGDYEIVK